MRNARKAPGYIDIGEHDDIISVEFSEVKATNMKSFLISQKHSTFLGSESPTQNLVISGKSYKYL